MLTIICSTGTNLNSTQYIAPSPKHWVPDNGYLKLMGGVIYEIQAADTLVVVQCGTKMAFLCNEIDPTGHVLTTGPTVTGDYGPLVAITAK